MAKLLQTQERILMPNQINKTAQNFLENSQVIIESLEGTLTSLICEL
jgi:hypothetical protein